MVVELTCKGGVDKVEAFAIDTVVLIEDVVMTAGTAAVAASDIDLMVVSFAADIVKKEALANIGIEEMRVAVVVTSVVIWIVVVKEVLTNIGIEMRVAVVVWE